MNRGDFVKLKSNSDGPLMIVEKRFQDLSPEQASIFHDCVEKVCCIWHDKNNVPHERWYYIDDLDLITDKKE